MSESAERKLHPFPVKMWVSCLSTSGSSLAVFTFITSLFHTWPQPSFVTFKSHILRGNADKVN